MPNIRSEEELSDFLSTEIIWRKKEIATLKLQLEKSKGEAFSAFSRAALVMLYAHWEGFMKSAGEAYLRFISESVNRGRIRSQDLPANIIALSLLERHKKTGSFHKPVNFIKILTEHIQNPNVRLKVPIENIINCESNLNSSILKDVLYILNLDDTDYLIKAQLIDEKLLGKRNKISHGENEKVSLEEYDEIQQSILSLMHLFKNQITNKAIEFSARRA